MIVRVSNDVSQLRSIRKQVRAFVDKHGGSDAIADDFELAVCELATNVIEHADAESVTAEMVRLEDRWQVAVCDADKIPSLDEVSSPPTDSPTGRGLFIVQAVMDEVSIVQENGRTVIRCVKFDA